MIRTCIIVAALCCTAFFVGAETVSLSGTVVKSGTTTGIAGVDVSLANIVDLSDTTDANGAFTLTGATPVQVSRPQTVPFQFHIRGTRVVFSHLPEGNLTGRLDIFSGNGKKTFSFPLSGLQNGRMSVMLPELSPGINIIRLVINGKSFTRTFVSLDNTLFLSNESPAPEQSGAFTMAKQAAAAVVDTVIASKSGYTTKKVPIGSYTEEDIVIEMDETGGGGTCTRDALQAAVDSYITAQKAGDPTKMPLASEVKYIQNMKDITAEESICNTALPNIDSQRDILDVDSCRTFTEIIITDRSHPYVIGIRLKVDDEKISEINTIVSQEGDWLFDASKYLSYSQDENWDVLPVDKRTDRQAMIDAGDGYFDLIFDWTEDSLPWADDCYRIEGGSAVARPCSQGTVGNSVKTTCRTYVVDVDKGAVNIYCYFGFGPDSHLFKFDSGEISRIHTMTACTDTVGPGEYCWGIAEKGEGEGYCDW